MATLAVAATLAAPVMASAADDSHEGHAAHEAHAELRPLTAAETGLPAHYDRIMAAPAPEQYPAFALPFPCGEVWRGASRSSHSPSAYSIDFNQGSGDEDLGSAVLAPVGGTVTASKYATDNGYGNYIVIDHGGSWSSLYAHLDSRAVEVGATVATGQFIGTLGRSSATYTFTAHLHFEQRYGNVVQPARFGGTAFVYWEQYLTSGNCSRSVPTTPGIGDVNGDGRADAALWRPSTGRWMFHGAAANVTYGAAGDIPVPADWDGDGDTDVAIFRPSTGAWYFAGVRPAVGWGVRGDVPVPADYDGDGDTDVAVYRPSSGVWYIKGASSNVDWGTPGDIPVPADYDGDGRASIVVWRPSTGTWFFKGMSSFPRYGAQGDIPVPADWNGDGNADIAVWRPSTGNWYFNGAAPSLNYGLAAGDVPVPANLDADPAAEVAIWRPTTSTWYFRGVLPTLDFGQSTDLPVSSMVLTRPVLRLLRLL